jgi:hypothetical protein
MAKQHQARGEDGSALKMYRLAKPYFPENEKLTKKIALLEGRIPRQREEPAVDADSSGDSDKSGHDEYHDQGESDEDFEDSDGDNGFNSQTRHKRGQMRRVGVKRIRSSSPDPLGGEANGSALTPRTAQLLSVINSRDVSKIKLLKGVGVKRAEGIIECLQEMDELNGAAGMSELQSLKQLGHLRGVGSRILETMRLGLASGAEG